MEIQLSAPISKVTVYPDRAGITCAGEIDLEPGTHRIIISELPAHLESDSARIKGRGTAQVRLQGVDITETMLSSTPSAAEQARAREIALEIEGVEDEIKVKRDGAKVLESQLEFTTGLRQSTELYAKGLARGKVKVADQAELLNFMRERDTVLLEELRRNSDENRQLKRKLEKLRHDLKETGSSGAPNQRYYQAEVDLEARTAGRFLLELTYVTRRAAWEPLYDLRLARGEEGYDLEISMLAAIYQGTGQDWKGVELTVSTARPALNQRMPKLEPWYLSVPAPPPPMPRMMAGGDGGPVPVAAAGPPGSGELYDIVESGAEPDEFALDLMVAGDVEPEPEYEAEEESARVNDSGMAVSYTVPGSTDIPGDGTSRKVLVNRFELKAELEHIAVPAHTGAVFRRVKAVNDGPGPLPAGKSSLFMDEEYIGPSRMKYAPGGDKLRILFGVEERIKIKHGMVRRETDKTFIKDDRQLKYAYETKLENLLPETAKLLVKDHLPVSRSEEIKLRDEKFDPEPDKRTDLNLLEWRLELASNERRTIRRDFTIRHPRALNVVGLPD